jgi:hypothetical protein
VKERVFPVLRGFHSLDLRPGLRELAVGGHAGDEVGFHNLVLLAEVCQVVDCVFSMKPQAAFVGT